MNVAVQTEALGTVQLHATMQNNLFGATLTVDRSDTQHFLSAQLPALVQTLSAKQVQVSSLQLQQQAGGGQNEAFQNPQQQPQARPSPLPPAVAAPAAAASAPELLPLSRGAHLNLRA
ncbi:MAG: flagellar hook-length control protein FliK [Terriglobales bacterium]